MVSAEYEKTSRNKVNRKGTRGVYDYETIHNLINETTVLHVSFNPPNDDPYPVVLPMLGCTGNFANPDSDASLEPQDIYLHGYVSARMMKLETSGASSDDDGEGIPLTICATQMDGLVLALTPFNHSCNYRSAVVFGRAELVTSEDEKLHAMQLVTDNLLPQRWNESRTPPTKVELQSTSILRVRVVSASAKVRRGPPGDDRPDLKDEATRSRVWTGVVPAWMQWGEPQPCAAKGQENQRQGVPKYLDDWVFETNEKNEDYALKATSE